MEPGFTPEAVWPQRPWSRNGKTCYRCPHTHTASTTTRWITHTAESCLKKRKKPTEPNICHMLNARHLLDGFYISPSFSESCAGSYLPFYKWRKQFSETLVTRAGFQRRLFRHQSPNEPGGWVSPSSVAYSALALSLALCLSAPLSVR